MTKKLALTASVIMLVAISDATAAEKASTASRAAPASENALKRLNSFDSSPSAEPNAHRYHGGPKSIN